MVKKEEVSFDGSEIEGGTRSVSVSVTLNAKPLGVDAFVKLENTFEFPVLADASTATLKRFELADALTAEALEIVENTAKAVREKISAQPRGAVSVPAAPAAVPAGTQTGQTVQAGDAGAVRSVANGAQVGGQEWLTCPSRFGDGDLRFLSTASYSTSQMEADVSTWLLSKGLNPHGFRVWDNRSGPKGLEAGVPQGSVANVKVARELIGTVPEDFGRVPAARVKFNHDGSLYIWLTKEFEGYAKYGLAAELRAG